MQQWNQLMMAVVNHGTRKADRTGVGTYSLFGQQIRLDMTKGFPAVTTKLLHWKPMIGELAGFLHGATTVEEFHKYGSHIWDANASHTSASLATAIPPGTLGRIYGAQWRDWRSIVPLILRDDMGAEVNEIAGVRHVDQLAVLVKGLKENPFGRRHIVTAWNPGELDQMCLPPCHLLWQCNVRSNSFNANCDADSKFPHTLDLRVDMRSVDLFLGLPFNMASYGVILTLLAKECNMLPGELVFQMGDCHVYLDHLDAVMTVLHREPKPAPMLSVRADADIFDFDPDTVRLVGYDSHPPVTAPMHA
jgi:thymidylate synthase